MQALLAAILMLPGPPVTEETVNSPLVINEFMAWPSASATEAEGEWLELFNRSSDYVNLSGWRIRNQSGQEVCLGTYLLPPGGFYVLGASSNQGRNGGYLPDFVYTGFALANTGTLSLRDPAGQVMESIVYTSTWPVSNGESTERFNPGWMASFQGSWSQSIAPYGAGDMGTPGGVNSIFENSFAENTWAFIKAFVQ